MKITLAARIASTIKYYRIERKETERTVDDKMGWHKEKGIVHNKVPTPSPIKMAIKTDWEE